jgi:hypothetical protein
VDQVDADLFTAIDRASERIGHGHRWQASDEHC